MQVRRPRTEWLLEFQGMMVITADQIWWTAEMENVFYKISQGERRAMKKVKCTSILNKISWRQIKQYFLLQYLQQLNYQLDEVVILMGKGTLTNNDRKKIDMVLTIDVHIRDIVEIFVRDNITDPTEFDWESQLR